MLRSMGEEKREMYLQVAQYAFRTTALYESMPEQDREEFPLAITVSVCGLGAGEPFSEQFGSLDPTDTSRKEAHDARQDEHCPGSRVSAPLFAANLARNTTT
jgi:hypothetical protein